MHIWLWMEWKTALPVQLSQVRDTVPDLNLSVSGN